MAKPSKIDQHPDRAFIERELALGHSVEELAKKTGVSIHNLYYHKRFKMPAHLKAKLIGEHLSDEEDLERLRVDESKRLLANLATQRARLLTAQDEAIEQEAHRDVATLANQIHKNLKLVGEYTGEFGRHQTATQVNILISPQYLELRAALLRALIPHPHARDAVKEVFQGLEREAADKADGDGAKVIEHDEAN